MSAFEVSPAYALAHVDPAFFESLTEMERLVLAFDFDMWLRPNQRIPRYNWRSFGLDGGRGFGKSYCIATELNRRVECGETRALALMAPTEGRVKEVQVDFLVATSPPWFRAEAYRDGCRWPNGVEALAFTPEAPGRSRSGNFDAAWMCEIVDWEKATRLEAYRNLATATRVGAAQIFWDTTSKGKNEVIQHLRGEHKRDPIANIIQSGTTFDNPLLSRQYLKAVVSQYVKGSRAYDEEVLGLSFDESAGALWRQSWLDGNRSAIAPVNPEIVLVSLDPSLSGGPEADEAGVTILARDSFKHIHVLADLSGRQAPEDWCKKAVDRCAQDAAGVLYERNHAGDMPRDLIKVQAAARGMRVEELADDKKPFPPRNPGTIYLRSITSKQGKGARAEGPAALYEQGRVHHVGTFDLLELEMTTWEPDSGKSPNRLDACAQGVAELAGLRIPDPKGDSDACQRAAAAQKRLHASLLSGGTRGRRRLGL